MIEGIMSCPLNLLSVLKSTGGRSSCQKADEGDTSERQSEAGCG